jgi:hypothetical protein
VIRGALFDEGDASRITDLVEIAGQEFTVATTESREQRQGLKRFCAWRQTWPGNRQNGWPAGSSMTRTSAWG